MLRRRVYGADHDQPGPRPDRRYAELVGGPLNGLLLGITGFTQDEVDTGVALATLSSRPPRPPARTSDLERFGSPIGS
ncbi:hypothetical protein [Streptomyces sp. NPDC001020]